MHQILCLIKLIILLPIILTLAACGGGGNNSSTGGEEITANKWTWISGSQSAGQPSTYGTKGIADPANVPGGRAGAVSWVDTSGNFWLFGGYVATGPTAGNRFNDLWKFDGTAWTWIAGSDTPNQTGIYGMKGVTNAANTPGGRAGPVAWTDMSGKLLLFGGYGYDSVGTLGYLNDLWMFDGVNWTWVSGSNIVYQSNVGNPGTTSSTNAPGARSAASHWLDTKGHLWLFGGSGLSSGTSIGFLNDLWMFDGTNWTWVSGGYAVNLKSSYGTKGIPAVSNMPGGRNGAISWIDVNGDLWLFGGVGYSSDPNSLYAEDLADLWKFDGSYWTWMSGSNIANIGGTYGSRGVPKAGNMPGARFDSVGWLDINGHFWMFGGYGRDSAGNLGELNDMWMFDGTNWTWKLGSNVCYGSGSYGTKGVADSRNIPGARYGVSWTNAGGYLWLFGGSSPSYLNDLWRFGP